jgi:hypothetical protein
LPDPLTRRHIRLRCVRVERFPATFPSANRRLSWPLPGPRIAPTAAAFTRSLAPPPRPCVGSPVCHASGQCAFSGGEGCVKHSENQINMKTKTAKPKSDSQNRLAQLSAKNTLPPIDFTRRRANRSLDTDKLIALLRSEAPRAWSLEPCFDHHQNLMG